MGTITSGIGLVSGINTSQVIDELISLDQAPIQIYNTDITSAQSMQSTYASLGTDLSAVQTAAQTLERPATFEAATATSSDEDVLTATASNAASPGSYQMQVARVVSSQQTISAGFSNYDTQSVGAGTITIEEGGGEANSETALSDLNGGTGISRGQFRITDRAGNQTIIDTSDDVTLDDVVGQINNSVNTSVKASISGDHLVLTDTTGKTASNLMVQDLGGGSSASSLGIATASAGVAATTVTGTSIYALASTTPISSINDGLGMRTDPNSAADLTIKLRDGSTTTVNLHSAATMGDVLTAMNNAFSGSKLTASINTTTNSITLTDNTIGLGTMSVADANGSHAAEDLGIATPGTSGTLNGKTVLASIDSALVSRLNGGSGLNLGSITITDRAGHTGGINLAGATSVQDILNDINNNALGVKVTASLKASGNGIQIVDSSGGTGSMTIANGADGKNVATQLGLAGTYTTAQTTAGGADLQHQWLNENTKLAQLNGGKGVPLGAFTVTNSKGVATTIDLTNSGATTVGEVIANINAENAGVTASVNATGDGIQLTDTAGGANTMTVKDTSGSTASALLLTGTASGTGASNVINGSYEKTISVSSSDTLASLQTKINAAGLAASASILNDGSSSSPYRLSITSTNSGRAGRLVIDGGTTNLNPTTLVKAQDAAILVGGNNSAQPLLVTGNSDSFSGVIPGVDVTVKSPSTSAVTLTVSQDVDGIVKQVQSFVDAFNKVADDLSNEMSFTAAADTNSGTDGTSSSTDTSYTSGPLLGDSTALSIQSELYSMMQTVISGAGQYSTFAQLGLTLTSAGDGSNTDNSTDSTTGTSSTDNTYETKLSLDEDSFRAALANDPSAVSKLFTMTQAVTNSDGTTTTKSTGLAGAVDTTLTQFTDPVNGMLKLETDTLNDKISGFQNQIDNLNAVIANKKEYLTNEFANMETTLSTLQSQQKSISGITSVTS